MFDGLKKKLGLFGRKKKIDEEIEAESVSAEMETQESQVLSSAKTEAPASAAQIESQPEADSGMQKQEESKTEPEPARPEEKADEFDEEDLLSDENIERTREEIKAEKKAAKAALKEEKRAEKQAAKEAKAALKEEKRAEKQALKEEAAVAAGTAGVTGAAVLKTGESESGSKAEPEAEEAESGGILSRLKALIVDHEVTLNEKKVDEALMDLQIVLLESDVAYPVAEAITNHMKEELLGQTKKVSSKTGDVVENALRHAIEKVLGDGFDLVSYIQNHEKPVKIIFTGVNGTGKTTSVAKIAHFLQSQGLSVVCGAADTFRAGAIDQLRVHCERIGVKLIAHQEGSDPSSVLYDTIEYAKAHNIDVVLGDTAGRFHNKQNLMNQLDKIRRVVKPDLVFYVDEAVAGNDAVIRAEEFEKTVSTDGVILTKVDMDPKGGAAISIAYTIGKPLVFIGVGQGYDDMKPFTPSLIVDEIFGEEEK